MNGSRYLSSYLSSFTMNNNTTSVVFDFSVALIAREAFYTAIGTCPVDVVAFSSLTVLIAEV